MAPRLAVPDTDKAATPEYTELAPVVRFPWMSRFFAPPVTVPLVVTPVALRVRSAPRMRLSS